MHAWIKYLADGELSLNVTLLADQASKEDADRNRESSISQIACICFSASQWKSRLLLACTAGELETHSLGLSLQPEPDSPCTSSNKQARINNMIYSENV